MTEQEERQLEHWKKLYPWIDREGITFDEFLDELMYYFKNIREFHGGKYKTLYQQRKEQEVGHVYKTSFD